MTNIATLQEIGAEILQLLSEYHNPPRKELLLDAIFLAYLKGRSTKVARQHYVRIYGSTKPQRIDFRIGGTNPAVIEFACRSTNGTGQLTGSQNLSELRKLSRVSTTQAKLRALLLLDAVEKPLKKDALKATYDKQHAGRGKFRRHPVRVVYVHRQTAYNFLWDPFK